MDNTKNNSQSQPTIPSGCPMHKSENNESTKPLGIPSDCPMHKGNNNKINELNMMPELAQTAQDDQKIELPKERVISSIPKSTDTNSKWEYPSPQQFYNALRRKGWETPEEEIETMVDIHNFLNEEAWQQILKWESKYKWILTYPSFKVGQRKYHLKQNGIHFLAPEEKPGVPVFHLDIRPALDDVPSVMLRFKEAAKAKWEQWFPSPPNTAAE
ncbi:cytochrome c/c1 heme lyase-domain-containing protein [Cokeromyces recurvatus]|uniref:cytochrome c/c1 heme lyase-domain-containing protein n=1 Tax=Cokeromyces recurvatus TaxID=90255 RepID=UPI0022201936|nr:cytochrome c/c1 heme lyase-domain-containing protein [Cokeromyces recurvatus]KAI7902241.1 cytochrome c/c1 heme lyase-domain-containing protein [Cokeromyces recurvatus]